MVSGSYVQTGWRDGCPHPSTYSTWSGFLSSDSKRLIQQGTDVDARVNASPYAWWEAIDGAHNNPEAMFQNYTVNPGDHLAPTTAIFTRNGTDGSGGNTSLVFTVYDGATNKSAVNIIGYDKKYSGDYASASNNDQAVFVTEGQPTVRPRSPMTTSSPTTAIPSGLVRQLTPDLMVMMQAPTSARRAASLAFTCAAINY
jgi:hypothetical protein